MQFLWGLGAPVVDLVLIMSVNPGFGGQSFIESQVEKIRDLRKMCAAKVGLEGGGANYSWDRVEERGDNMHNYGGEE